MSVIAIHPGLEIPSPNSEEATVTIDDALDRFLVQLEADGRSPHTIRQYRRKKRRRLSNRVTMIQAN